MIIHAAAAVEVTRWITLWSSRLHGRRTGEAMEPRPEPRWDPAIADALSELADELPGARMGRMFGHPALYIGAKLCACAYGDGIGLKLPAPTVQELLTQPNTSAFTPYGKAPMRQWVHLRMTSASEVRARSPLFEESASLLSGGEPDADLAGT